MSKRLELYAHSFASIETAAFNVEDFSRLKFGSERIARIYAAELVRRTLVSPALMALITERPCVIIAAPATTVPVSATRLAWRYRELLNHQLVKRGANPVEWTHIHRDVHYNHDYSSLDEAARRELLTEKGRFINRDYIEGKNLLFIDDVRITGTHEEKLEHLLASIGAENDRAYVAYARYTGSDATIEARLNHCFVKTAKDLLWIIQESEYFITPRVMRLLLESNELDLEIILEHAGEKFVYELYHAMLVKSYHVYEPFSKGVKVVCNAYARFYDPFQPKQNGYNPMEIRP